MLDHETFEVKGAGRRSAGRSTSPYDFWWHLGQDTMITSEWGTPNMVRDGVDPELLLAGKYGNCAAHLGPEEAHAREEARNWAAEQQMVLELRPAHDPRRAYGFVGVVDLAQGSVLLDLAVAPRAARTTRRVEGTQGHRDSGRAGGRRDLPPLLQGFRRRAAAGH